MIRKCLIAAVTVALIGPGVVHADDDDKASQLPKPVAKAVKSTFPEAKVLEVEKVTKDGETVFEVKLRYKTGTLEAVLTPKGAVLKVELEEDNRVGEKGGDKTKEKGRDKGTSKKADKDKGDGKGEKKEKKDVVQDLGDVVIVSVTPMQMQNQVKIDVKDKDNAPFVLYRPVEEANHFYQGWTIFQAYREDNGTLRAPYFVITESSMEFEKAKGGKLEKVMVRYEFRKTKDSKDKAIAVGSINLTRE